MPKTSITVAFPDLDGPAANSEAAKLLSELKQDAELRQHLDLDKTQVKRTDPEALDFGVTLVAVLGTPALIILANTIKSWIERTGTTSIEINGACIENVRSRDVASILAALEKSAPPPGK